MECSTSTAQSGYSMRLGVKLMESDVVEYDHTVRDGMGHIIQYLYNGTGLDPLHNAMLKTDAAIGDLHKTLEAGL